MSKKLRDVVIFTVCYFAVVNFNLSVNLESIILAALLPRKLQSKSLILEIEIQSISLLWCIYLLAALLGWFVNHPTPIPMSHRLEREDLWDRTSVFKYYERIKQVFQARSEQGVVAWETSHFNLNLTLKSHSKYKERTQIWQVSRLAADSIQSLSFSQTTLFVYILWHATELLSPLPPPRFWLDRYSNDAKPVEWRLYVVWARSSMLGDAMCNKDGFLGLRFRFDVNYVLDLGGGVVCLEVRIWRCVLAESASVRNWLSSFPNLRNRNSFEYLFEAKVLRCATNPSPTLSIWPSWLV